MDLEKLTKKELLALEGAEGLTNDMTKAEIIAALEQAPQEEPEESAPTEDAQEEEEAVEAPEEDQEEEAVDLPFKKINGREMVSCVFLGGYVLIEDDQRTGYKLGRSEYDAL